MPFSYREGALAGVFIPLIAGLAIAFVASAQAANCPTIAGKMMAA